MTIPTSLPDTATNAEFVQNLAKDGFVVVPNVVPKEHIDGYIEGALQWLEKFPLGFDRNDKKTWRPEHLPWGVKGGLYNRYSVPHEDFVWKIRSEPGVIDAFSKLWGTKELITSFDGINITPPHGSNGLDDEPTPPWPHIDQNPHKPNFELVQGIVTLSECGPKDGGLVVMRGSHLKHPQYFAENGGVNESKRQNRENSYLFDPEDADWYKEQGCEVVKVEAPAGSLILWDSRMIHWNCTPMGDRTRFATYVCMCPASHATNEGLKKKAEIFRNRQGSTHWPALNDVPILLSGPPQRNGVTDPHHRTTPWTEPQETDTVLRLAGVKAY